MFQREGAPALKYDLSRITEILKRLKNPHDYYPTVHIAGTNGKGTVSHMLASTFQAAGYRVGLHTSPHYVDFRERIKINGQLVPKDSVVNFVEKMKDTMKDLKPSFFEMTVAMAFDYFKNENVDIAIIETGLGGRLDSTNILQPVLSVITNIGFDHQEFLGNTLQQIASEKAGIIKNNTPVVIGERQSETDGVFKNIANERNAPIFFAADHLIVEELPKKSLRHTDYVVKFNNDILFESLSIEASGPFQKHNLRTVLQALFVLSEFWDISKIDIIEGLSNLQKLTAYIGRWTWLSENPLLLTDSAHNEAGLSYVADWLNNQRRPLHLVIGMVNGKIPEELLADFPKEAAYYFCKPNVPRGMDPVFLRNACIKLELHGHIYQSVAHAIEAAKSTANPDALVFIGGSSFVAAEALAWKNNQEHL